MVGMSPDLQGQIQIQVNWPSKLTILTRFTTRLGFQIQTCDLAQRLDAST